MRPFVPLTLALVLLSAACTTRRPAGPSTPPRPPSTPSSAAGSLAPVRVEVGPRGSRQIRTVPLDDYVRDVVVNEIAVGRQDAALARPVYETQAILARTYAVRVRGRHGAEGFDLCSTTHCQVYRADVWRTSRWAAQVDEAVARSRGVVVRYGGQPVEAVFHAHCGGHTSDARDVWRGSGAPYLAATPDPFCVRERPVRWTWRASLDGLLAALNRLTLTAVGPRLDGVQVVRRDEGGRVAEVLLSGARAPVVSGEQFRAAVVAAHGAASLRSTRFEARREGRDVVFEGAGSGHGVGVCQTGLIGRVRAGQSPREILETYYRGARVD